MRLDIEGGELAKLKGARHTLRSAKNVLVVMEAHLEDPSLGGRLGRLAWQAAAASFRRADGLHHL